MGLLWSAFSELLKSNAPEKRLLLLGLDAAGKTTMLYRLKLSETVHTIPTMGFNVEHVQYKNLTFVIWDIGGQEMLRGLWQHYFNGSSALIFVVDSADTDRFPEARTELFRLTREEHLKGVPLLVFANKSDMQHAASATEIEDKLELNKMKEEREYKVFQSCCLTGEGLYDGLNWLASRISKQK